MRSKPAQFEVGYCYPHGWYAVRCLQNGTANVIGCAYFHRDGNFYSSTQNNAGKFTAWWHSPAKLVKSLRKVVENCEIRFGCVH
jgi:hypothetical protein